MRKHILLLTIFILITGIATSAQAIRWDDNGHDYIVVSYAGQSWESARSYLKENYAGYTLATVTSAAEQNFLKSSVLKDHSGAFWLGGFQDADQNWQWDTGEKFDGYASWEPGEPNDYFGEGSEQHLAMWSLYGWDWNDEGNVGNIKGFIAEMVPLSLTQQTLTEVSNSQSVPEPSTVMLFGFALLGLARISLRRFKNKS